MWDYIVMGQIPGTSVQVTFEAWLFTMAGLLLAALIYKVVRLALADDDELVIRYQTAAAKTTSKHHSLALTTKLVLAIRIRHIIQTAAYSRWLITRQQMQA